MFDQGGEISSRAIVNIPNSCDTQKNLYAGTQDLYGFTVLNALLQCKIIFMM